MDARQARTIAEASIEDVFRNQIDNKAKNGKFSVRMDTDGYDRSEVEEVALILRGDGYEVDHDIVKGWLDVSW